MITRLRPSTIHAVRYDIASMTNEERRVYFIWKNMIRRCHHPKTSGYIHYGGRGIFVSEEFRNSFEVFFEHIGAAPSRLYTLDRIDNEKGYDRGNIKWASKFEQMRNRRCTNLAEWKGRTLCLADWAPIVGIDPVTLWGRYKRGLRGDDLFTEASNRGRQKTMTEIPGVGVVSLAEVSSITGIKYSTIAARYAKGWRGAELVMTTEQAMELGASKRPSCQPGYVHAPRMDPLKQKLTDRMETIDGKTQRVSEWARERGVNIQTVFWRLYNGLGIEDALAPGRIKPRRKGAPPQLSP